MEEDSSSTATPTPSVAPDDGDPVVRQGDASGRQDVAINTAHSEESAASTGNPPVVPVSGNGGAETPSSAATVKPEQPEKQGDPDNTHAPAAIKQAVSEALKEDGTLAALPDIKELLIRMAASAQSSVTNAPTKSSQEEKILENKESLRQAALDVYRDEYKELSETWKSLETKAQGTVTIAGIFIAASFTFAKDLTTTRLSFNENLILGAAIICLIISVLFSVMALKTREVDAPPSGERILEMTDHLIDLPDLAERRVRFIYDQAKLWESVVRTTKDALYEKESFLRTAQGFLVVAVLLAATISLRLLKV